jgi:hypothetical protein
MRKAGTFLAIACIVLFFSPGWLPFEPGLVRFLAPLLFVAGLTMAVLGAVLGNLPEHARMTPLADAVPAACRGLLARMQELGFARLGPVLRVHLDPGATIVPLWSETERTYATVFVSDGAPGKAHFDFVTVLDGEVGLTSSPNPAAGVLPQSPRSFLQIFANEEPETLLGRHLEGRDQLARAARVEPKPRCASFEALLAGALRRQRQSFLRAPLRNTWTALWRVVTKSTPDRGPVLAQPGARGRIDSFALAGSENALARR